VVFLLINFVLVLAVKFNFSDQWCLLQPLSQHSWMLPAAFVLSRARSGIGLWALDSREAEAAIANSIVTYHTS
jgi:hypothetical protein